MPLIDRAHRVLLPGFEGYELPRWLVARLEDGLGGVCLFAENVRSPSQTQALTEQVLTANPAAVIAIDEEGGDITRLHALTGSPYPSAALLGRIDDLDLTAEVASAVAAELRSLGINLNLAPVADVNSNPANAVIGTRSFGDDPARVAAHVAAYVKAHQAEGVAVSAKHFPGHGDTSTDSHTALPRVDGSLPTLDGRDIPPFVAALAAGARSIMTAHVLVPALDPAHSATMSRAILGGLLRQSLGFDGTILSDALDMVGASGSVGMARAAVLALGAGCDLLCLGPRTTEEQIAAIETEFSLAATHGLLDPTRVDRASARILNLTIDFPLSDRRSSPGPLAFDLNRIMAAFDVRTGTTPTPGAPLVVLDSEPSMAGGAAPWGPASAGAAVVQAQDFHSVPVSGPAPIVVGRSIHLDDALRAVVDSIRKSAPRTVVVDMGWPSPDRAYADVATFGSSPLVAAALLHWIDRTGRS